MTDTQQIPNIQLDRPDKLDGLRRELEQKLEQRIDKIETKIDSKLSEKMFFWSVGGLVAVAIAVFSYFAIQNSKLSDKIDTGRDRITVIETKIEGNNK